MDTVLATSSAEEQRLQTAAKSFIAKYKFATPPQFLVAAYEYFLNRGIDEEGYNNWLIQLYSGMDRAELIRSFLECEEFQQVQKVRHELRPIEVAAAEPALPERATLEQYQDIWIKGQAQKRGVRECADRFRIIAQFCKQYTRPFTILDVGANLGYFSLRLTESFDATSVALEGVYGDWLKEVLEANQNPRVVLLQKLFKLEDLRKLAEVEHFDLILGLSVIHHLDGDFSESLETLRSLGDHVILELPNEANACGQTIVQQAVTAPLPADAAILGYGKSHLDEGQRPIYLLSRPKTKLARSFLGTGRSDLSLTIHSNFNEKRVEFHNKTECRPWVAGINLQTYLWFNGSYPSRTTLADAVEALGPPPRTHRDVQPWNVILGSGRVHYIDFDDPNHTLTYSDTDYLNRLIHLLRARPEVKPIAAAPAATPSVPLVSAPGARVERVACPFCAGTDAVRIRSLADIVKCGRCETVYLRTRATVDAMEELYQSYGDEGSHIAIPKMDEQVVTSVLRRDPFLREILQFTEPGGRLLDVGCGWGAFLFNARQYGFEPTGLEITRRAAAYANSRLSIPVAHTQFLDTHYDPNSLRAVTMLHVLEHLPQPRQALEKVFGCLEPGGVFCGIVPNIESFCSKAQGDSWFWLDPNYHYVHYSPLTLREHLEKAGFVVERIYTTRGDYRLDFIREVAIAADSRLNDEIEFRDFLARIEKEGQGEEIRFFARKPGPAAARSTPSRHQDEVPPTPRLTASIVVPVFESDPALLSRLETIFSQASVAQIIVADATQSGLAAAGATGDARVQVARVESTTSFAEACNAAAACADGDCVVFVDPALEPEPGWLEHALACFEEAPEPGLVASKLLYADRTVQHAGIELFRRVHPAEPMLPLHRYRLFPENDPMINRGEAIWAASASCLFVRRALLQQVGSFSADCANAAMAGMELSLKARHQGWEVWYEPKSCAVLRADRAIPTPDDSTVKSIRPFLRKWQPEILRAELDSYVTRRDGRFCYLSEELLPNLPDNAWDSARLQSVAERLFRLLPAIEPFHAHFGGAGDALLMLSTFYGNEPNRTVVSFPNSLPAARSLFDAFPDLVKIYLLPPTPSARVHIMLRVLLRRLPNCLGLGVTPETDYFQEWCDGLDIFEKYGVAPSPGWARAFKKEERPFSVAIAPRGSLSGMVGSKRNLIPPAQWPELVRSIQACGYKPVLIGTPDEAEDYPRLPGCEEHRSYSFREQMEVIASCPLFVGADSWGKTFAGLAGVRTFVFDPVKGRDWSGKRDASDFVFIDPWESIQVVSGIDHFRESFWREVNDMAISAGNASPYRAAKVRRLSLPHAALRSKVKVAWEGSFSDAGSLSHVNRSMTNELSKNLQHLALVEPAHRLHGSHNKVSTGSTRFRTQAPPHMDVTVRHAWPPSWNPPTSGAWVLIQPWEFGSLPLDWLPHLQKVDEIWAPTEYVRRVYIDSGVQPSKVKVVPNGIDPELFRPDARPLPLATSKKFKFLFVGGTVHRKGPDLLLKAYLEAFTAQDDVCLVIKDFTGDTVYAGQTLEAEIEGARKNPSAPEILYFNDKLAAEVMPGLYTACDCLVHPYRGEGFALPVLEAMACGLPVIVTSGGATDDFATPDLVYQLEGSCKRIGTRLGTIRLARPGWQIEPSLSQLRERMLWLVSHPDEARAKGRRAAAHAREHWTWKRASDIAAGRIEDLVQRKSAESNALQERRTKKVNVIDLPQVARIGDLAEASEQFRGQQFLPAWNLALKAIETRPHHPEAYLLLAEIAHAAGDFDRARDCATRARELAPKWKRARKLLDELPKGRSRDANPFENCPERRTTPRLSVCIIARNEEAFIGGCLDSVKNLAAEVIVVDTGSTDRTASIAQEHGARVFSFRWTDDFSAARNYSLEQATGDWILILDADEQLPLESHAALRQEMSAADVMAYRLPIVDDGKEDEGCSYVPRLFRNAPGLFFVGRIHEQVFTSVEVLRQQWGLENRLGKAVIRHYGYAADVSNGRNKNARNLKLLGRAIEEFPNEPNLLMSYGLELARSGQLELGLDQYWEAFHVLSAQPLQQVVPELRETLLAQISTHLMSARDYHEIVRVLTSPLAKAGGLTASLHFTLGLALMELRQFSDAANQMRQCIAKRNQPALTPINKEIRKAAPRHCLALCLKMLNQPRDAAKAFRQAMEEEPQSYLVQLDYARFLAVENPVEALQLLHQLICERPSEVSGWAVGGQIALGHPDFLEFARDWTGEALKVLPQNDVLTAQRLQALLLNGNVVEALSVARGTPSTANAALTALQIFCEFATGHVHKVGVVNEPHVSQEFVAFYRLLLARNGKGLVHAINESVPQLRDVLPTAASVLEQALRQAALAA